VVPDEIARRFDRNRAALGRLQPEWTARLPAAPPEPAAFEHARDGLLSARTEDARGRRRWLGCTSMPSISAAALLEDFTDLGGNVVLPDVGSGFEIQAYLGRMQRHTAVFVCVDRPDRLRLALCLYDYSTWIDEGRLVFVDVTDATASLVGFFERCSGYELPGRMVRFPHVPAAEFARIQSEMENAGRAACAGQNALVDGLVRRIAARGGRPEPAAPTVAVVSVDPRRDTTFVADQIAGALAQMGWGGATCVPSAPDRCHTAARLGAIVEAGADVVLCVNCGPGHLASLLPPSIAIACWFQPEAAPGAVRAAAGGCARVFVSTPRQRDEALAAGIPPDRLAILEPGIPDACGTGFQPVNPCGTGLQPVNPCGTGFQPVGPSASAAHVDSPADRPPDAGPPPRYDVGLVLGLHDDRPAAANVLLSSHVELYEAVRVHCRREFRRYADAHADAFLQLGQRTARVELTDATLRDQFIGLIRTRIGPAAVALGIARALCAQGRSIGVWGHTGGIFNDGPAVPLEGPLAWERLDAPVRSCRALIIPTRMPIDLRILLLAAPLGVPVLAARPALPLEQAHPQLAPALTHVTWFDTAAEALERIGPLIAPSAARRTPPSGAVLREHTLRRRLEQLVAATVREHGPAASRGLQPARISRL